MLAILVRYEVSEIKVILTIDSLVAGGAQRQLILLYRYLLENGYDVKVLIHNNKTFFQIDPSDLLVIDRKDHGKWYVLFGYVRLLAAERPDVVVAYGLNASLLAELSKFFLRSYKLIVSERNLKPNFSALNLACRRLLHYFFADEVFVNSRSQQIDLSGRAAFLNCQVILNTLDNQFLSKKTAKKKCRKELRILGLGKYLPQKNILFLIESIRFLVIACPHLKVSVRWYGDSDGLDKLDYRNKCSDLINKYQLGSNITLYSEHSNVNELYEWASVLVLPSVSEGTPNVALEAMAYGLPVCLSDTSDNRMLVKDQCNGFVLPIVDANTWGDAMGSFAKWDSQMYEVCLTESLRILSNSYGKENLKSIENLIKR